MVLIHILNLFLTKKDLLTNIHPTYLVNTERLILVPFTLEICEEILQKNYSILKKFNLKIGENWPDEDFLECLPRIVKNLQKVENPTGFESWMIIKKDSKEIIGDIGFKGFNFLSNSCDLGYGIIESERRKGYAKEACLGLINWVLESDPTITITASTLLTNFASMELLKKLEFSEHDRDETYSYWERKPKNEF